MSNDLRSLIREIPDFPSPGILFRDITPLLKDPQAFGGVIDTLAERYEPLGLDAIVGIESRGFILGAPLAYRLRLPYIPVRKQGKLPFERMSIEYALEYGTSALEIHQDALERGQQVVIVDDLLATGGTAAAAAKLVELLGGRVREFAFLIELTELGGRPRLEGYSVFSLLAL
jgi:adenine phosphoribosyltransferase